MHDQLEALETVDIPKDDEKMMRTFTVGKCYTVLAILHPKRSVCVIDDSGRDHLIEGDYIEHFKLHTSKAA